MAQTTFQDGPRGHSLDVEGVTQRYGEFLAVDDVSLAVKPGEIVALLGPSGCGKTTLLRVIAGFLRQTSGRVLVDGAPIDKLVPGKRNIGIVFQSYALFPHMTARENVGYGLAARGTPAAEASSRVAECLDLVQMGHLADRLPIQLSGGQQQRVALARALAISPSILLLDEPFAALDKNLRFDMQLEIKRLQRRFGLTAILVTHDQEEAMSMADRLAVMNMGRVEQFASPATVYDDPSSLFVNNFIGSSNLLHGRVAPTAGGGRAVALDLGATIQLGARQDGPSTGEAILSVRPEHLILHDSPGDASWPVRLRMSVPLGSTVIHDVEARDGTGFKISASRLGSSAFEPGAELHCSIAPGARAGLFPHASS